MLRQRHTTLHHVLMRCHIHRLAKHSGKMEFAERRLASQIVQGDWVRQMRVNIGQHVTQGDGRESPGDGGQSPLNVAVMLDQMR